MTVMVTGGAGCTGAHMTLAPGAAGGREPGGYRQWLAARPRPLKRRCLRHNGRPSGRRRRAAAAHGALSRFKLMTAAGKAVSGEDIETRDSARRAAGQVAIAARPERLKAALGRDPKHNDPQDVLASAWALEQALRKRNR